MRVLVFTSLYPNNIWPYNGVFVKERMTQFVRQEGCDVQVVAPVPYFPALKISHRWLYSQVCRHEVTEGLQVSHPRYFMIPKVGMALHGWLMFFSVIPTIKQIQKNFDFDVIDAHYVYPDGFAAVLLGLLFRKPVVVSARGSDINLFKDFPLIRRLLRYTLMKADGVIAVSQALKDAIRRLGVPGEKVAVIPNGVDPLKFSPLPKEESCKRLGLPDQKIILSVGRLTCNKGFDVLVRAFKILLEKFQACPLSLVIVGEGAFRKQLEEMISSAHLSQRVHLVGAVPHEELALWYNAADIFCLASSQEGYPNVLLESLACGTPVVATSVGGIPEIIHSDAIGFLTERDEWDIAEKLCLALNKTWHSDAIVRYAQEHTWNRVTRSVFGVFASVLNSRVRLPSGQITADQTAIDSKFTNY
jgi:glycosyltransferase involved in cell wall biosynthesis